MLLTISTTNRPATDLGFLLHKHPRRVQTFELSFGAAHVFYPEADEQRCTAALLLDVDPIHLVRKRRGPSGEGFLLEQYVNDRPYVASSFMSVAIARVLGSALAGRCEGRQTLADQPIPITARMSAVPCRGGDLLVRRLFEPLGYSVTTTRHPLDESFPQWGDSSYLTIELRAECRLCELLTHLYVLIPVLDDQKHYWVGEEEVVKLVGRGEGWLSAHPEHGLIARRYLRHQTGLTRSALQQLREDEPVDVPASVVVREDDEQAVELPLRLHDLRLDAVMAAITEVGARSVVDLGCGEGRLLRLLLKDHRVERIVGMDVSHRVLELAAERLNLDGLPPKLRERLELIQGSLIYRDDRLRGFDAATVVEVVEHLDPPRLAFFERVVFECAHPTAVIVTTPNIEYNIRFEAFPAGRLRHKDHRFEWTRCEFRDWGVRIASRFGYSVEFRSVGTDDAELGPPTQMAIFTSGARDS